MKLALSNLPLLVNTKYFLTSCADPCRYQMSITRVTYDFSQASPVPIFHWVYNNRSGDVVGTKYMTTNFKYSSETLFGTA